MVNFDTYLNKLRWDTVYGNFTDMTMFKTDSIVYEFKHPLSTKEQNAFVEFLGDSNTLNNYTPVDFCNFFIRNRIEFTVKFKYNIKLPIKRNQNCYKIVKILHKRLDELRPTKWHRIYDEADFPEKTCNCLIQTQEDFEQNTCQTALFNADKKSFISPLDTESIQNVLCWKSVPKETLTCETT